LRCLFISVSYESGAQYANQDETEIKSQRNGDEDDRCSPYPFTLVLPAICHSKASSAILALGGVSKV